MVTGTTEPIGDLLFGKTRQAVMGLLFLRPDESFHLRQIVRLSGAGVGPVQRELAKLVAAGLILREQRGQQVYFQAARSPVFDELRGLLVKTAGCADVLREALLPLAPRIRSAFIFGSFAKDNARAERRRRDGGRRCEIRRRRTRARRSTTAAGKADQSHRLSADGA